MFRESIRRSIRQIREMATPVQSPGNTVTSMAELELGGRHHGDGAVNSGGHHHHNHQVSITRHLPPAYTSVIMEMRSTEGTVEAINERLTQMVAENSSSRSNAEASTSSTSALSESNSSSTTTTTSETTSNSSSGLTAAELTRLLRDSFRRSARNTIRSSLRFIRSVKNSKPSGVCDQTATDSVSVAGAVTDDETGTDTDQGARHLVHGAARIHRDPNIPNVVVTLPNGDRSESVA